MAASSLDSPEEGFVEEAAGGLVVPTPRRVKFMQAVAPRSAASAVLLKPAFNSKKCNHREVHAPIGMPCATRHACGGHQR